MQRRRGGIIFAIIFLDLLGFGIIMPQLGIYARHYEASGLVQGLLVGSYSAMQFVFAPLLGRWSDRVGRRPVLLVSLFTSFCAHLLFGVSRSLALLFVSRVVDGLGGANIATAQAYLSDVTPAERRARAMAMIGMAFGLGFVLGPAVGAVVGHWGTSHLGAHGGNLAIGLVAAACSLGTMVLTVRWLPESLPPDKRRRAEGPLRLIDTESLRRALALPVLPRLLLVALISTGGFAVLHAILTYFVVDVSGLRLTDAAGMARAQAATGKVFAWIGCLSILAQGSVHAGARRVGEAVLLRAGLALMVLALVSLPLVHSSGAMLVLMTPLAIGNALCSATIPALLTLHSPPDQRGEILGVNTSLGSIGRIGGPLSGGFLYDLGRAVPFAVGAVLCAVALYFALRLPRHAPGSE
jgi:multidrug resistance protein